MTPNESERVPDSEKTWHAEQRPRVAVVGLSEIDAATVKAMCPTVHVFEELADFEAERSQRETDLVVADAVYSSAAPAIHVLLIGANPYDHGRYRLPNTTGERIRSVTNRASELLTRVPTDEWGAPLEQLAAAYSSGPPSQGIRVQDGIEASTLAWTVDATIASLYRRHPSGGWGLVVPPEAALGPWLRAFLRFLNRESPESVPTAPARLLRPEDWYGPSELRKLEELASVEQAIAALETQRVDLAGQLAEVVERADQGERRVLWDDGQSLVDGISELLRAIGFDVLDVDGTLPEGTAKAEDLHVTLSHDPDWIALAEVKGYQKGAKSNDLRQINEHATQFAAKAARVPSQVWWVTNDHRTLDPGDRPPTLAGSEDKAVAANVLVIPTRMLYRLWRDVAVGLMSESAAQDVLRSAEPGVWTYDGPLASPV